MQVALGRSPSDEIKPSLFKLSKVVESLFNTYEEYDFARTGCIATEKIELKEGPLEQFTHEMEPFLRSQGMPVRLNKAAAGNTDG